MSSWQRFAVGLGLFWSCQLPAPAPPGPLTPAELQSLGIDGGVAGRVVWIHGNCMPGCVGTCGTIDVPDAISVEAFVAAGTGATLDAGIEACAFELGGDGLARDAVGTPVASLMLHGDRFGISLAPGAYFVTLVDRRGCAYCMPAQRGAGRTCVAVDVVGTQTVALREVFYQIAQ